MHKQLLRFLVGLVVISGGLLSTLFVGHILRVIYQWDIQELGNLGETDILAGIIILGVITVITACWGVGDEILKRTPNKLTSDI